MSTIITCFIVFFLTDSFSKLSPTEVCSKRNYVVTMSRFHLMLKKADKQIRKSLHLIIGIIAKHRVSGERGRFWSLLLGQNKSIPKMYMNLFKYVHSVFKVLLPNSSNLNKAGYPKTTVLNCNKDLQYAFTKYIYVMMLLLGFAFTCVLIAALAKLMCSDNFC